MNEIKKKLLPHSGNINNDEYEHTQSQNMVRSMLEYRI